MIARSLAANSVLTALLTLFGLTLTGCAAPTRVTIPARLDSDTTKTLVANDTVRLGSSHRPVRELRQVETPRAPSSGSAFSGTESALAEPPLEGEPIVASLEEMPLPAFINEAFGNLLHINFQMEASLAARTDLVTLRLSTPQSPRDFYRLVLEVLRRYGIGASWDGALMAVGPATATALAEPPLVLSGRNLPDVPISHRPIFQLIELQSVRNADVRGWLRVAFPSEALTISEDAGRNAIILFGKPELVMQAADAVRVLDRPFMRGRHSTLIEPAFVNAQEMTTRLIEVLQAEGYAAASQVGVSVSTLVLPILSANSVLVFASDKLVLKHVVEWARAIDQPNPTAGSGSVFYYTVRNTKAEDIAQTLQGLQTESTTRTGETGLQPPGSTAAAAPLAAPGVGGLVGLNEMVVDKPRNALIYQGAPADWQRLLPLIQQMDMAARQVMIEVTIAEVSLDDNQDFGVTWFAKDSPGRYNGSWFSGLVPQSSGGASGGLTYLVDVAGQNRAQLRAFADDSRVSILSTPRLLVKSGEEGSIDVGTEVPTITQQTTAAQQTGGTSNLLQSVQYRRTGILLTVTPTVYSDDRVDLDVSQEVSEALPLTANSAVASPSIFNRSVKTSLTLRDGGSVLLGGLMSQRETGSEGGVPGLKDIPVLGHLFKSSSKKKNRTELVLIIVPYIIDSDEKSRDVLRGLRDQLEFISLPDDQAPGSRQQ